MAELGETDDPRALIPGNPQAIDENVVALRGRGEAMLQAADGLKQIDTEAWTGAAADEFRDKFSYEPGRWYQASDAFLAAANALEEYAASLRSAQSTATEAIQQWQTGQEATEQAHQEYDEANRNDADDGNGPTTPPAFVDPGEEDRYAARETLARAREQLADVGERVGQILQDAGDAAPEQSMWDDIGDFLGSTADAIGDVLGAGFRAVGDAADTVLDVVGDVGRSVATGAADSAGGLLRGLGDLTGISALDEAADNVEEAGEDVGDTIDDAADEAGEDVDEAAEDAADTVEPDGDESDGEEPDEPTVWDGVEGEKPNPEDIHTTDERRVHILDGDGDGSGGGHAAGTGRPNKTEFPESWDDDKIIDNAEDVAKKPDSPPEMNDEGRWEVRETRDGVDICVIVDKDGKIITAFPEGGEGVIHNDEHGNPK